MRNTLINDLIIYVQSGQRENNQGAYKYILSINSEEYYEGE